MLSICGEKKECVHIILYSYPMREDDTNAEAVIYIFRLRTSGKNKVEQLLKSSSKFKLEMFDKTLF